MVIIYTLLLDYWSTHTAHKQPHACVCVPLPSSQSAHTRQGCGSLRRRVLSECRVLARLEASPVTRLLGMERNRQGATQGLPGLQAWRAGWPGGRKGAFRDSLFQDSFATTPFALPFPTLPPRAAASAAAACVPRAWYCMARYGHGVTHATVTHPEAIWGPASHRAACTEEHHQLTTCPARSCTLLHEYTGPSSGSCQPSPSRPVRLHRERRGRDPGNLGTDHVHWKSDESVVWPPTHTPALPSHPWGERRLERSRHRLLPQDWMHEDVMSVSIRTHGRLSFLPHLQNQDSSFRPETSTLGTNTIREAALARLFRRQKRGRASSNR